MHNQSRLFGWARLASACLLLATGAGVAAQDHADHAKMATDAAAPSGDHADREVVGRLGMALGQGARRGRGGDHPARHRDGARRQPARTAQHDRAGQADLRRRTRPGADHRLDLRPRRRTADRHRGPALHPQGDHHPDRQGAGRGHQHDGRPRHHAAARHARTCMATATQLDQARRHSREGRAPASRCSTRAAGGRATRSSSPRPTSIRARPSGAPSPRSTATRSASRSRSTYMHYRRDHLRRGRARRGRPC